MGSDKLFHKNKIRKAKELARQKANKAPYESVLIICEGTKTECNHIRSIIKQFKLSSANVVVIPGKGSAPISIVEHAIEIAKTTAEIDRIFCIFDCDNHESYQRALMALNNYKLRRNDKSKSKVVAITSTPCYELWILLHFRYTTKSYRATGNKSAAENLIVDLRKVFPLYNKNSIEWFNELIDKLEMRYRTQKD